MDLEITPRKQRGDFTISLFRLYSDLKECQKRHEENDKKKEWTDISFEVPLDELCDMFVGALDGFYGIDSIEKANGRINLDLKPEYLFSKVF